MLAEFVNLNPIYNIHHALAKIRLIYFELEHVLSAAVYLEVEGYM